MAALRGADQRRVCRVGTVVMYCSNCVCPCVCVCKWCAIGSSICHSSLPVGGGECLVKVEEEELGDIWGVDGPSV